MVTERRQEIVSNRSSVESKTFHLSLKFKQHDYGDSGFNITGANTKVLKNYATDPFKFPESISTYSSPEP